MLDIRAIYAPHSTPFLHQWECLQASFNKRAFAILMEPGLGKTKIAYDTAAVLYERGHIRGLLVAAPNDVHDQWITEQLPLHLPPRIQHRAHIWEGTRFANARLVKALLKPLPDRLTILSMNHEALSTATGRAAARKFLLTYPSLFVLDESHDYKDPRAARTRTVFKLSHLAFARRIMTGTLTDGSPLDYYAQFKFLDERILGQPSFINFKHRYGIWEKQTMLLAKRGADGKRKLHEYETLQEWQRLDELSRLAAPYIFSKRKEDCEGLPPKMYAVVPTHLSDAQLVIYNTLLDDGLALLTRAEAGKSVTALDLTTMDEDAMVERIATPANRMTYRIKLTLLLRLQQCVAGYVTDDAKVTRPIEPSDKLPRAQALLAYVRQALKGEGKIIVWANYRSVLDELSLVLEELAPTLRIHGGVVGDARSIAILRFKDPKHPSRILVAHPRTMGTGQNLAVARTVIYYTRSFSYIQRKQSEDRAHRIGQTGTVTVADLVARDAPTDQKELDLLKTKAGIADKIESFSSKTLRGMLTC